MADVTVVIAAESHQRVRALLDGEAGIVVAGEARSLAHAFVLVARLRPAVLLLDFGRRLGAQILRRLIRARGLARHARRFRSPASTRFVLKSNRPSPAPLITHESPNTRETTPSQALNPRRFKWRI